MAFSLGSLTAANLVTLCNHGFSFGIEDPSEKGGERLLERNVMKLEKFSREAVAALEKLKRTKDEVPSNKKSRFRQQQEADHCGQKYLLDLAIEMQIWAMEAFDDWQNAFGHGWKTKKHHYQKAYRQKLQQKRQHDVFLDEKQQPVEPATKYRKPMVGASVDAPDVNARIWALEAAGDWQRCKNAKKEEDKKKKQEEKRRKKQEERRERKKNEQQSRIDARCQMQVAFLYNAKEE